MELQLENLSKSYGKHRALDNFSLTLEPGIYALLGVNGAGKTTLLRILCGLLKRDSGRILLAGQEAASDLDSFLGQLGYLPQYPRFYPNLSVVELLQYVAFLKKIPAAQVRTRVESLLEAVNLETYRNFPIRALSGGTRQRLGIAQALINEPSILLLDEATAGLDLRERLRFRNLIAQLSQDRIVLMATHLVEDAEALANQVVLLHQGRNVGAGSLSALLQSLAGQVWSSVCGELPEVEQISQVRRVGTQLHVRTVGAAAPSNALQACQVEPTLEDVFLYFCTGAKHERA